MKSKYGIGKQIRKLTPKVNVDSSKYTMAISKGLAYVHGYRVEATTPTDIITNRSRTTSTINNNTVFVKGVRVVIGVEIANVENVLTYNAEPFVNPDTGDLVINVINMANDEQVEVSIISDGVVLDDTIYEVNL